MPHLRWFVAGAAVLGSCTSAPAGGGLAERRVDSVIRVSSEPAAIVDRQIAAYNRRDAETFAALYAPDAVGYEYPQRVLFTGRDSLQAQYARFFATAPDLHVRVTQRIVHGPYVLDHELITGMPGADTVRAVAIYEVRNGAIATVRYIP